jgi:hypothetical protein
LQYAHYLWLRVDNSSNNGTAQTRKPGKWPFPWPLIEFDSSYSSIRWRDDGVLLYRLELLERSKGDFGCFANGNWRAFFVVRFTSSNATIHTRFVLWKNAMETMMVYFYIGLSCWNVQECSRH